jgi:protein-tyrosine-phosphatase
MAEALLRARLAERGIDEPVSSAGMLFDDRPPEDGAVRALARRGLDISGHRSRTLTPDMIAEADLVIGMERRHVREAAVLVEGSFSRAFTLPELVASGQVVGPRGDLPMRSWAGHITASRKIDQYLGDDPTEEVPDPMGQSRRAFRATADLLDELLTELVDLAWADPTAAADDDWSAVRPSTGSN